MKPWDYGTLKISENKRYFMNGDKPFFWLGDTAWLLFCNLNEEEAYRYLKNRADKGFNVIQAVLVYTTPQMQDINKMDIDENCNVCSLKYWEHCDKIIEMAEKLGLYMALLPSWGSIVKKKLINDDNISEYAEFLAKRYGNRKNIIWLLGGDIKPVGYENIYNVLGNTLKQKTPNQLIGFHPFGRCMSSSWFANSQWLDFNMFQSGHRRYDQCNLGKWDDNGTSEFFGEDNWKYVEHDLKICQKPTLDGEPSYEWIVQGLHDTTQPYWTAKDVRRYAYWSVFAGACGHTYGDNSVMQFFPEKSAVASYGAKDYWYEAIHHEGSGQMGHLKNLMESVDFTQGKSRDDLLISGQREKYERIAIFAGENFLFAYNYLGKSFTINLSEYKNADLWYFSPSSGIYSYIGKTDGLNYTFIPPKIYDENTDITLVVKK